MAEAAKKTRKPQGPRTVKPLHLLVRVTGDDGQPISFTRDQVSIEVVKDPAVLLEMLTGGADMTGSTYVKFTPPVERKSPAEAA